MENVLHSKAGNLIETTANIAIELPGYAIKYHVNSADCKIEFGTPVFPKSEEEIETVFTITVRGLKGKWSNIP
jgi:hypothetical protein